MNRRYFLMNSVGAAGALYASPARSPNDTVRVACVGNRNQGGSHIRVYSAMPNVEVVALCDVDESIMNQRLHEFDQAGKKRPAAYTDFRKLLEDKSIDVVSIATPNHWHTLQAIWALQAGKDVYVEKPCSYNMFEARQIVAAARKYNHRIVQHGANCRSNPSIQEAHQKVREGLIGDVYMSRGLCFKRRDTIGRAPVEPVPAGVHYDLWLGPAPKRDFTRNRFHYNWHWLWDYGDGDIGNQGIHELDMCRWLLGVGYPTKVSAIGGHFMFDDDQETPNTLTALYEFDNPGGQRKMMTFEVRHGISNHEAGIGGLDEGGKAKDLNTIGNIFYGSKGNLMIEGYGKYYSVLGPDMQPGPTRTDTGNDFAGYIQAVHEGKLNITIPTGIGNNFANFIQVVRSRKQSDLNAPIDEGSISTTLVHLANISYRLGRTLRFDAANFKCIDDEEANRMFTRNYRAPFIVPTEV